MSVLILAYYSIKDPLCQSAVLQYFKAYADELQGKYILLTFEHEGFPLTNEEIIRIEGDLSKYHIKWHRLNWHSGKLKILKKGYDLVLSLRTIWKLRKIYSVDTIYSEGFPGAVIGHLACSIFKLSHIIHSFEPHADYMMEAGVWTRFSWEYYLLKYFEKAIALKGSWIMTATNGMVKRIESWGVSKEKILKIPSCVDTDLFVPHTDQFSRIRSNLGFNSDDIVVVYLGKIGGMYWSKELFECIKSFTSFDGCTYRFLILNKHDHEFIESQLCSYGVSTNHYRLISVDYSEVSWYLSAADIGLVAVRQRPSKIYCSPIKTGEYLASGIPVIVPKGISDDYLKLQEGGLGVVLENTNTDNLASLPLIVQKYLTATPRVQRTKSAVEYAFDHRSLIKHKSAYMSVFRESNGLKRQSISTTGR